MDRCGGLVGTTVGGAVGAGYILAVLANLKNGRWTDSAGRATLRAPVIGTILGCHLSSIDFGKFAPEGDWRYVRKDRLSLSLMPQFKRNLGVGLKWNVLEHRCPLSRKGFCYEEEPSKTV